MSFTRPLAAVLLVLVLASSVGADSTTYRGPEHFGFTVPDGWVRVPDAELSRVSRLSSRYTGMNSPGYLAAFELERAERHFQYPYMLLQYHAGDTSTAYRDLKRALSEGMEEARELVERNAAGLAGGFELSEPTVDRSRDRIFFTLTAEVAMYGRIRALLALHLGAEGVVQQNFYAEEERYEEALPHFMAMVDSLRFDEGHGYTGSGGAVMRWLKGAWWWLAAGAVLLLWGFFKPRRRRTPPTFGSGNPYQCGAGDNTPGYGGRQVLERTLPKLADRDRRLKAAPVARTPVHRERY